MRFIRWKKGFIGFDYLGWWMIGLAVLIIALMAIFLISERGTSALQFIKDLLGWK